MESLISPSRSFRRLSRVESVFTYTGKILAVRSWESPGFAEIDLHLPGNRHASLDRIDSYKMQRGFFQLPGLFTRVLGCGNVYLQPAG